MNPTPQEGESAASESHELPGLRPLNSDLIKHAHHEKKPDLSVRPPPVYLQTQSPSTVAEDSPPSPVQESSVPPPAPPPPAPLPPAPAAPIPVSPPVAPPPAPAVPLPALEAPPPPPVVPPPATPPMQMDFSNQMFPGMEPNIPVVPIVSNFIPLSSIPLPAFSPGTFWCYGFNETAQMTKVRILRTKYQFPPQEGKGQQSSKFRPELAALIDYIFFTEIERWFSTRRNPSIGQNVSPAFLLNWKFSFKFLDLFRFIDRSRLKKNCEKCISRSRRFPTSIRHILFHCFVSR